MSAEAAEGLVGQDGMPLLLGAGEGELPYSIQVRTQNQGQGRCMFTRNPPCPQAN